MHCTHQVALLFTGLCRFFPAISRTALKMLPRFPAFRLSLHTFSIDRSFAIYQQHGAVTIFKSNTERLIGILTTPASNDPRHCIGKSSLFKKCRKSSTTSCFQLAGIAATLYILILQLPSCTSDFTASPEFTQTVFFKPRFKSLSIQASDL